MRLGATRTWRVNNFNARTFNSFYLFIFNSLGFFPKSILRIGKPTSKRKRRFYSKRSWNRYVYYRMSSFKSLKFRISAIYYPLRLWALKRNLFLKTSLFINIFFKKVFDYKGSFTYFSKVFKNKKNNLLSFLKKDRFSILKFFNKFSFIKKRKFKKLFKVQPVLFAPYKKLVFKIISSSRLKKKRLRLYRTFFFLKYRSRYKKRRRMAYRRKLLLGKRRRRRLKKVSGVRLRRFFFFFNESRTKRRFKKRMKSKIKMFLNGKIKKIRIKNIVRIKKIKISKIKIIKRKLLKIRKRKMRIKKKLLKRKKGLLRIKRKLLKMKNKKKLKKKKNFY